MDAINNDSIVDVIEDDELDTVPVQSTARRLIERGLTTVEYAIGLLAAAALALVLLRIFNDNQFFQTMFDWVINVFNKVSNANGGTFRDLLSAVLGS